ncbi:MAG: hypothetical protein ABIH11_08115 [Candidatus Altiarchaeota archaeon]
MKEKVKLIVVIPVGPGERMENVLDTVESVAHYMTEDRRILILDDSGRGAGKGVKAGFPDVEVLEQPGGQGAEGGLYMSISNALKHAYENYDFRVVLKLDSDGLVIGGGAEDEAVEYFERNRDVGVIGSYRVSCTGEKRDFIGVKKAFVREMRLWRMLISPGRCSAYRKIVPEIMGKGYELGEHCQGGAYFMSQDCVKRLVESGLLGKKEFNSDRIPEDSIIAMLVWKVGLRLGDFATGDLPMGIAWSGLPCSPEELLSRGKKITHSVRSWGSMSEGEIRGFFSERRNRV